jgi:hypothetical protein
VCPGERVLASRAFSLLDVRAEPLFLCAEFWGELGGEVLGFEDLSNLDLGLFARHRIGTALHPLDGFLQRCALPEPEAGDQLLSLGERTSDDGALLTRET